MPRRRCGMGKLGRRGFLGTLLALPLIRELPLVSNATAMFPPAGFYGLGVGHLLDVVYLGPGGHTKDIAEAFGMLRPGGTIVCLPSHPPESI